MNIITIETVSGDTQIKVNGEYIATINGVMLKSDMPELSHSVRYENKHGYVWVSK